MLSVIAAATVGLVLGVVMARLVGARLATAGWSLAALVLFVVTGGGFFLLYGLALGYLAAAAT